MIDQVNEEPNNRPLLRIYKLEKDEIVKKAEYDRFRDISNPSLRDNQSFTVLADGYIMFQSKNYVELIDIGNGSYFMIYHTFCRTFGENRKKTIIREH